MIDSPGSVSSAGLASGRGRWASPCAGPLYCHLTVLLLWGLLSQSVKLFSRFHWYVQSSLVLHVETLIARPCWYYDLEVAGIVVLKCHFCLLFSGTNKVSSFQIFSYKYLDLH